MHTNPCKTSSPKYSSYKFTLNLFSALQNIIVFGLKYFEVFYEGGSHLGPPYLGNPYVGITVNVRCNTFFLFTLSLAI